jgi:hypothetical protein
LVLRSTVALRTGAWTIDTGEDCGMASGRERPSWFRRTARF